MSEDQQLAELIDEWQAAFARGEYIPPEELCAERPELLAEAKLKIDTLIMNDERFQTEISPRVGTGTAPQPESAEQAPSRTKITIRAGSDGLTVRPEFEQLRFHAQGGLGTVYIARDRQLNRDVALKFIHEMRATDKVSRERFLLEAEVTGRLEHPGVVPVHGLGETRDGRLFYAMRFIRGETLETAIRRYHHETHGKAADTERRLEFRALLNRFIAVCNTIAYAHIRGIIHRDLKPENILLGPYGETLVADWGLALPVGRDEHARNSGERTLVPSVGSDTGDSSGQCAGTPAYMSPEQASGSPELGPSSDIYGLGAVLYKILAGKSPFGGKQPLEIIAKVRSGSFAPPRQINPAAPPALNAICLKAMAFEPQNRYRTALELAADVEQWMADEPVSAHTESRVQRVARWARRNRGMVQGLAVAGCLLIVVAIAAAILLGQSAKREHDARIVIDHAREQGLWVAAQFAASMLANEIDLRWRILEAEANDATLKNLLTEINENPRDDALRSQTQGWIDGRFAEHRDASRAESWFVTSADGTQVGRSPASDSIGENFSHRDYFHGQGRDLPAGKAAGMEPIKTVHRSTVYRSSTSDKLKVAFSVPVWTGKPGMPNRHVLGVLGMSVDLGEFRSLESKLGTSQIAVLVDTNEDMVERDSKRGLVLHHPLLDMSRDSTSKKSLPRLEPSMANRLIDLRAAKTKRNTSSMGHAEMLTLNRNYRDPVTGANEEYLAAFEPVIIHGRSDPTNDIGWVIIVQEPTRPVEE